MGAREESLGEVFAGVVSGRGLWNALAPVIREEWKGFFWTRIDTDG
jgi:hypothetical protein